MLPQWPRALGQCNSKKRSPGGPQGWWWSWAAAHHHQNCCWGGSRDEHSHTWHHLGYRKAQKHSSRPPRYWWSCECIMLKGCWQIFVLDISWSRRKRLSCLREIECFNKDKDKYEVVRMQKGNLHKTAHVLIYATNKDTVKITMLHSAWVLLT